MATEKFSSAFFVVTENFWLPYKGGHIICFWKALDEGFPKIYDMHKFDK
jgi:hypothetical protein